MEASDVPVRAVGGNDTAASVREARSSSASFMIPPLLAPDLAVGADAVEIEAWLCGFVARSGAAGAFYYHFGEGAVLLRALSVGEVAADAGAAALMRARAAATLAAVPLPAAAIVAEEADAAGMPFAILVPVRDAGAGAACLCLSCADAAAAAWSLGGGYGALLDAARRLHAACRALPVQGGRGDQLLTDREAACLRLAAAGETLSATAMALGVAPRTVEAHLARATRKLRAANKINAVAIAVAGGLLRP